ncbi:MAG: hypothetical protein U0136_04100 [Bdellovibrionota bacterium]
MPVSEEEQVRMMLEAMGASSIEEIEAEPPKYTPPEPAVPPPVAPAEAPVASAPQRPADPLPEPREPLHHERSFGSPRDITVPMLMRLLGLPNANQMSVMELKLDSLTVKVAALSTKLDRIMKTLDHMANEVTLDRIDFQLNTIRSMLRRSPGDNTPVPDAPPPPKKARVLTSAPSDVQASTPPPPSSNEPLLPTDEPPVKKTTVVEPDNLEELNTFPDDATFQRGEAQRIRTAKPK